MSAWRELLDGDTFDLSIPLDFSGEQPNHFGAPYASAEKLVAGDFVGDVARGGSCECATLTLTPHCNGTHTETVRHLTGDGPAPFEALDDMIYHARVVSVAPVSGNGTEETTEPAMEPGDLLITAAALSPSLLPGRFDALVVRTLPNDTDKRTADWSARQAPFFTREAMQAIVDAGVRHLLFDGPSLDRGHDQGRLAAHRIFFGLAPGERLAEDAARPLATVTEMIFVPDEAADGDYLLAIGVPAFVSDAAPSRPVLKRLPR